MNPYMPRLARITEVLREASDIKTFKLEPLDGEIRFKPGQFVMISVFGIGEAPFAIVSSPGNSKHIEISVRAVGNVTRALHRLKRGDVVGIRGPLGNEFPLERLKGRDILVLAGGTGLLGVAALLWHIYEDRGRYGDVILLYGAREPRELIRLYDLEVWKERLDVRLTVDKGDASWKGHVGLVTSLLDSVAPLSRDTVAIACGPPVMLKATYEKLLSLGLTPTRIYVSLERQMKCGIGKCGRCMLSNGMFVCKDGPVFRCDQIPLRDLL